MRRTNTEIDFEILRNLYKKINEVLKIDYKNYKIRKNINKD